MFSSFRNISLLLLLFLTAVVTQAQQAVIVMKDSARVATEVRTIEGDLLIVKEGALSLNLIAVIKFSGNGEVKPKQELIDGLIKQEIIVYVDNVLVKSASAAISESATVNESDSVVVAVPPINKQNNWVVYPPTQQETPTKTVSNEDFESVDSGAAFFMGIGVGLDYGGLGARFTFVPNVEQTVSIGVFAAGGYAVNGLGFNAGLTGRFGNKRVIPTLSAMYGYNGVIKVLGAPQYDKTYFGPSIGLGFESRRGSDNSHIHLELILPIRSSAYYDDLKALQNNPAIDINDPFPILFSIGYHFKI